MQKVVPSDAILIPKQAERVFRGIIFDVYQWPQTMFDSSTATFEMVRRPDTVAALCIVNDKILTIEDEQPSVGTYLRLPGGRDDVPNESTEQAARREVREETGYNFANWRLVDVIQPEHKLEWFVYIYIAWEVSAQTDKQLDSGERNTVKLLGLDDFKAAHVQSNNRVTSTVHNLDDIYHLPEFRGRTVDVPKSGEN